jgi:hypothetical protein
MEVLGFTGTQRGMNDLQRVLFIGFVRGAEPTAFHHGDCVGADAQAHCIVRHLFPACRIVIHPPIVDSKRAFMQGDEVLPPKEYLERNRDIVAACDVLVAVPFEDEEQLRSGTWSTVRAARRSAKRMSILLPNNAAERTQASIRATK